MGRAERALRKLREQGLDTSGIGKPSTREEHTDRIEGSVTVEFASREQANEIRDRAKVREHLSGRDDRRRKSVILDDDAPEDVVDMVTVEAADATKEEAEKFGQVPLTDAEKSRVDFSQVNTLRARSIKGIAVGLGVDDWTAFVDPTLTVDEHREVMKKAAREDAGGAFEGGGTSNEEVDSFLGRAFETLSREERPRALEAGFAGDQEAAEFVRSGREAGAGLSSIFDVNLEPLGGGRVRVGGSEGDRVAEIHEDRPPRARAVDERKRSQQITLDPLEWASNPRRWDYPGVDTIQPENIHERRSERAQAIDERSSAKAAPSVEAWVDDPGRYDLEGVDSPPAIPEEERGRGPIRLGERLDILEDEPAESLGNLSAGFSFGLAGGEEADRVFIESEESRRGELAEGFRLTDREEGFARFERGDETIKVDAGASGGFDVFLSDESGEQRRAARDRNVGTFDDALERAQELAGGSFFEDESEQRILGGFREQEPGEMEELAAELRGGMTEDEINNPEGRMGLSNTGTGGVEEGMAAFGEGQEPPLELEDPGALDELADEFLGSGEEESLLDTSNLGSQMGLGGEEVETESQATFGFLEPDDSPDTRLEEESASTFGVDDRSSARRGSEREREETLEAGLEAFGGGERKNRSLDDLF